MVHLGGCLCGATRFQADAPALRATFCHCTFCQHVTGAAYAALVFFTADAVRWTGIAPTRYPHVSDGSGHVIHVDFCRACGATLAFRPERFPGTVGLHRGAFDAPAALGIPTSATKHIFIDSAQPETMLPAGVPLFRQHVTTPDGTAVDPILLQAPMSVAAVRATFPARLLPA